MTAEQFIKMVCRRQWHGNAKVVVNNGRRGTHYVVPMDQELPDDDHENTIFIRVEEAA